MSYLEHIIYLPVRFHETRSVGNLYNRLNDIEKIQFAVGQSLISLFCDIVLMAIALSVMMFFNIQLSFLVIIFIPILLLFTFVISIPLNKLQRLVMIKQAEVAGRFVDTFSGIKEIKTFSAEKYFTKRIREKLNEYIKSDYKQIKHVGGNN